VTLEHPNPWWLRAIFVVVAAQALELVVVFFQPELVRLLVPWPATPLNARFIASLYTALGIGVLLCALARTVSEVRVILFGIGIATGLLLLLTLPRLGELPQFPLFWIVFYVIDPLLVVYSVWRLRGAVAIPRASTPQTPLWMANTVVFGLSGALLLLLPYQAIALWPWALSEPLARIYSVFFLTLAICCWMCARETNWAHTRILALTLALLVALVLAVSLYHLDRFKPTAATPIWFALFVLETMMLAGLWIRRKAQPAVQGAAS
jgi:hypothetical protein